MNNLLDAIVYLDGQRAAFPGRLAIPPGFLGPAFAVTSAAYIVRENIPVSDVKLPKALTGYLGAIGFLPALGGTDAHRGARPGLSQRYTMLVPLRGREEVDTATSQMNSCLRSMLDNELPRPFLAQLCEVIGELHDNVWSHGKGAGFTFAQRYSRRSGQSIEIAIADGGIGFLRELRRCGVDGIRDDMGAIEWCIREGHTTGAKPVDDWAQSLPEDAMGNPFGAHVAATQRVENHHQGLGLAKLVRLVELFSGELHLVSGLGVLHVAPDSSHRYRPMPCPWQGVAATIRFDVDRVKRAVKQLKATEPAPPSLLSDLEGMLL